MTLVLLLAFAAVVAGLALLSRRRGTDGVGCCAPADPARDTRMRAAFTDGDDAGVTGDPHADRG
jgi:hypothetical protein